MKIFDSHMHCGLNTIDIIKNVIEYTELSGVLILPPPGRSFDILEQVKKRDLKNVFVAFSPSVRYELKEAFLYELNEFINNVKEFPAIKFYKDYNFENALMEGCNINLLSPFTKQFCDIALLNNIRIISHIADPTDFWRINAKRRTKQMALHNYFYQSMRSKREMLNEKELFILRNNGSVIIPHMGGFPESIWEAEIFLSKSKVDTSASIEELIYIEGYNKIENLLQKFNNNILFGSDLILFDVQQGKDKILTNIAIKYVSDSIKIFTGNNEIMKVPNYYENPWDITSLKLDHNILNNIMFNNAINYYNLEVN